jgi:hypothetical protein
MPAVILSPLETKLLRLVLDQNAAEGEVANGSVKLVRSLRSRGVEAIEIEQALSVEPLVVKPLKPDYGRTVMIWGRHKGQIFADIPPRDLRSTVQWAKSIPDVARQFAEFINDIEAFLNQA